MINCLDEVRKEVDKHHSELFKEAIEMAEANGINVRQPRVAGDQQHRANTGSASGSICDYCCINCTIPIIDVVLISMEELFLHGQDVTYKGFFSTSVPSDQRGLV